MSNNLWEIAFGQQIVTFSWPTNKVPCHYQESNNRPVWKQQLQLVSKAYLNSVSLSSNNRFYPHTHLYYYIISFFTEGKQDLYTS